MFWPMRAVPVYFLTLISMVSFHLYIERTYSNFRIKLSFHQWKNTPLPPVFAARRVYKYIRNATGTVGTITDQSGVVSHITDKDFEVLGDIRATYIDVHGYGAMEVEKIISAFSTSSVVEEFISRAEGFGMSIVELEWFWHVK